MALLEPSLLDSIWFQLVLVAFIMIACNCAVITIYKNYEQGK